MKRVIRGPYDKIKPVNFETKGKSLTHQSFVPECDINNVMRKFEKTGVLEHRNTFEGSYSDFIDVPQDYHEAMQQVLDAEAMFMTLPGKVRKRFENDPGEFLDFVSDPKNRDEMKKLGLLKEEYNAPESAPEVLEGGSTQKPPKASPEAGKPPGKGEKKD